MIIERERISHKIPIYGPTSFLVDATALAKFIRTEKPIRRHPIFISAFLILNSSVTNLVVESCRKGQNPATAVDLFQYQQMDIFMQENNN